MCVRLDLQPSDIAGAAQIEFLTLVPVVDAHGATSFHPRAIPSYSFQVVAVGPRGERIPFDVRPIEGHPDRLAGRVVFTGDGAWEIRVMNFEREGGVVSTVDPACYAPLRVIVRGSHVAVAATAVRSSERGWVQWVLLPLIGGAGIAAGATVLVMRRRRKPRVRRVLG